MSWLRRSRSDGGAGTNGCTSPRSSTKQLSGGHSLDDFSIVKAVQIPFHEQGGDLKRFDPELDDLADLGRERLQSRQRLGPNRHEALQGPLRVARAAAAKGSLEPAAHLLGHLEGTEIAWSRPNTSGNPRPEIPGEPSVGYLRARQFSRTLFEADGVIHVVDDEPDFTLVGRAAHFIAELTERALLAFPSDIRCRGVAMNDDGRPKRAFGRADRPARP